MTVEYSARGAFGFGEAIRDLIDGARAGRVWRAFAWEETKRRYRRSALGVAWIGINYAFFIVAIALFFGGFNLKSTEYFSLYVAAGIAAFTFLSSSIQDGAVVFLSSANWINSVSLPYSVYVYKSVSRALLPFTIQMIVFFAIAGALGHRFTAAALWSIPAFVIYIVNSISLHFIFGYLTARYRDIEHLVAAILRVLFFVTPILWLYEDITGPKLLVANLNPFTHLIEIFRAPLLGDAPSAANWINSLLFTAVGCALALVVSAALRRRLPLLV
jgi:ABC-type polysaccharide/polyol phosphate export permease